MYTYGTPHDSIVIVIVINVNIFQTIEYPLLRALIGYSSSGYPALSTGLQNTMDARASNHLRPDTIHFLCQWLFTGLLYTKTIIHRS